MISKKKNTFTNQSQHTKLPLEGGEKATKYRELKQE
jgi:hypothetical protein